MKNNVHYEIISVANREIWSLEEVKNYLRVPHANDDRLITAYIGAAITSAEQFLGAGLFIKKINCIIGRAPAYLRVKYLPISSVTKVWLLGGGEKEDITEDFGYTEINREKIWIAQKYLHKKIEVNYDAGYGEMIPKTILQGLLIHIGMMYDAGESACGLFSEIRDIYLPYRALKI